jgi:hypothetical protein
MANGDGDGNAGGQRKSDDDKKSHDNPFVDRRREGRNGRLG